MDTLKIHPSDNVAVALLDLKKGTGINADGCQVPVLEDIGRGHKIALKDIKRDDPVIKYGCRIGIAIHDIKAGSFVHTHNVRTALSEKEIYIYEPVVNELPSGEKRTFMGYRRRDGSVGIRNEIWIIPTVGCVNSIAGMLVRENTDLVGGSVEGINCFTHPYGCSQTGDDHETTKRILTALVRHPNAGGVLVLSLGCENLTMDQFKEELGEYDPERVKFLTCQKAEDELKEGRKLLEELAGYAGAFEREEIDARELIVGLKCGGSDGLSGITANPTVGRFSDKLIGMGGSTVLTEVPEMFGAESMLFNRCKNREIFDKAVGMVNAFKKYFTDHGQVVYENPSPGNKAGGITTLEDKSCGCVQKGGSAQIVDVLKYGERVRERGLSLLSGPGNDMVSTTDLAACGAHMILFTTGRGTPFGAPVPTVKISTNTELYKNKGNWIDFNAGGIAGGLDTTEEAAGRLLDLVLSVASGTKTKQEINEYRDIAILKDGVTL
ncbi:MAG: altronate dehydratase family protein [Lachnospiraceae bacterium]|nr:altronate dehydratase family protein [Lachnospiraceae bacterium]